MSTVVFLGPTLPIAEAREVLDAVYLPPAAQGDVYRAAAQGATIIGIVDGYFERVPALWHKEILWALDERIPVVGAASMGALRAAELAPFGMLGVGWVFEAYRDGLLEDDDEVAVAHAGPEDAYRQTSEAMVNVRRTLAEAQSQGVIGTLTGSIIERVAKEIFYPARTYPEIVGRTRERRIAPSAELDRFSTWVLHGRVDQKADDARAMLEVMSCPASVPTPVPSHRFEPTQFWQQAVEDAEAHALASLAERSTVVDVLEELRIRPGHQGGVADRAVLRGVAADEARRVGYQVTDAALAAAALDFRRERDLHDADALTAWLDHQGLSNDEYERLLRDDAVLRWFLRAPGRCTARQLLHELRADGSFGELCARAQAKRWVLLQHGLDEPSLCDLGLTDDALVAWYFTSILRRSTPIDLETYLRAAGFEDRPAFLRALLREYCYRRLGQKEDGEGS